MWAGYSWACHEQLQNGKHSFSMYTCYFKWFSSNHVKNHRECCFSRELHFFKVERQLCRNDRITENQNIFPFAIPVIIITLTIFHPRYVVYNHASGFCINRTATKTFNLSLWKGTSDCSKELRNSTEYQITSSVSMTLSTDILHKVTFHLLHNFFIEPSYRFIGWY